MVYRPHSPNCFTDSHTQVQSLPIVLGPVTLVKLCRYIVGGAQQVAHQAGLAGAQGAMQLDARVHQARGAGQMAGEGLTGGLIGPQQLAGF